jgi:hypothetical protein
MDALVPVTEAISALSLPLASVVEIFTRLAEADLPVADPVHVFTGASAAINVIFAVDKEILAQAALAIQS